MACLDKGGRGIARYLVTLAKAYTPLVDERPITSIETIRFTLHPDALHLPNCPGTLLRSPHAYCIREWLSDHHVRGQEVCRAEKQITQAVRRAMSKGDG